MFLIRICGGGAGSHKRSMEVMKVPRGRERRKGEE
jgi:hypothetical protein